MNMQPNQPKMQPNKRRHAMRVFVPLLFTSCVCLCAFSESLSINSPRIGDKYSRTVLLGLPYSAYCSGDTINLAGCRQAGTVATETYRPSKTDTISAFMTVEGSTYTCFSLERQSNILVHSISKPGFRSSIHYYSPYLVYTTTDTCGRAEIIGYLESIGSFTRKGRWEYTVLPGTVITPDGDTIVGLSSVVTTVCDTLAINTETSDTTMHIGTNRRWYSPGYRYPILEVCNELITKGPDTLDNLRQVFYFATYEQERQIEDDAANERIRELWKNRPNTGQQRPTITDGLTDHISYTSKDNTVCIHIDIPDADISVLVSDLHGRVWSRSTLAPTSVAASVSIDISKYPSGVYMFTVSDNNSNSTTFKIVK